MWLRWHLNGDVWDMGKRGPNSIHSNGIPAISEFANRAKANPYIVVINLGELWHLTLHLWPIANRLDRANLLENREPKSKMKEAFVASQLNCTFQLNWTSSARACTAPQKKYGLQTVMRQESRVQMFFPPYWCSSVTVSTNLRNIDRATEVAKRQTCLFVCFCGCSRIPANFKGATNMTVFGSILNMQNW